MQAPIVIDKEVIRPGQRRVIELAIPDLYTHSNLSIPIQVVYGRQEGPRLLVCAALHGDEINGVEIIRRLLNLKILDRIRGALIAVPVVNVYGFINQSRYLPDRRDLNRSFPGSETGSMAARLAYTFLTKIVANCTHGIDLHTGAIHRENLPQVRAYLDSDTDADTERMARAFRAPVILHAGLVEGSMRQSLKKMNIPVIVYEAGEALRFNEVAIRAGVRGIVAVMRELGMVTGLHHKENRPIDAPVVRTSTWVRAPQSGILRTITSLGSKVEKDEIMGIVADPFGEREEEIRAPFAGLVIGRTNIPLVNAGEALFHVARFKSPGAAAEAVETFQQELDPTTGEAPPREPPIA